MYSSQMLCVIAEKAARDVGPYLAEAFSQPRSFEIKADFHDVVTVHDRESQKRIAEVLFAGVPDSLIHAEESNELLTSDGTPKQAGSEDIVWFVDPIDGTSNFVSGYDHWCVSIAAARGGEVVAAVIYQPTTRTLYRADDTGAYRNGLRLQVLDAPVTEGIVATEFPSARLADSGDAAARFMHLVARARSVRRGGSTALSLAEVASGHFLATFGLGTHPWDVAAGALLVERAGGRFLGFDAGMPYALDAHTAPNFVATGRPDAALLCLETAGHPDPQAAVDHEWADGQGAGDAAGAGDGDAGEGDAAATELAAESGDAGAGEAGTGRAEGGEDEAGHNTGDHAEGDPGDGDAESSEADPETGGDSAEAGSGGDQAAGAEDPQGDEGPDSDETPLAEGEEAGRSDAGDASAETADSDEAADAAAPQAGSEADAAPEPGTDASGHPAHRATSSGNPASRTHARPSPNANAYWIGRPSRNSPGHHA